LIAKKVFFMGASQILGIAVSQTGRHARKS